MKRWKVKGREKQWIGKETEETGRKVNVKREGIKGSEGKGETRGTERK